MHCDDELVGLATLGLFDCQGAFTLISAYRSWIKDNTGI